MGNCEAIIETTLERAFGSQHHHQAFASPNTAPRTWLAADYNQAESRVVARKAVPKLDAWYKQGVDVHAYVCRAIAKVIQQNKIGMPRNLDSGKVYFHWKDADAFGKGDEEREISKRIVHGSNYGMGKAKLALILSVSESVAELLSKIYFALFPEVKSGYQAWIESELRSKRAIETPDPVRFKKVFWGIPPAISGQGIDEDDKRAAYASYPQIIVASLLNQTLVKSCTIFKNDVAEEFKEQWICYYGSENYDAWRRLRDNGIRTPRTILWGGMDVRLNVHDAGYISIPSDPDLVKWAARKWREFGEIPVMVKPEDPLVIPIEFKTGKTWGAEDQKDYKLN